MLNPKELSLWRDFIVDQCGICFDENKAYLLENKLYGLLVETGSRDFSDFYQKVIQQNNPAMKQRIVESLTIHETLWFRDMKPFVILEKILFPQLLDSVYYAKKQKIRIWSSACSTGQEPYSIAIIATLFCQAKNLNPADVFEITATDISNKALASAKDAMYNYLSISRGLSDEKKNRFFISDGKNWKIKDAIQSLVQFRQFNLKDPFSWIGHQDIIFCRNVCIYFNDNLKKQILQNVHSVLNPSGFLFLGATESLLGYTSLFQVLLSDGALYYTVKK